MRKLSKLLALVIAALLALALAVPALATETTGGNTGDQGTGTGTATITVNNAGEKSTYTAYKIFDVTVSGGNDPSYAYTIKRNSDWYSTVNSFAIDANGLTLTAISGTTNPVVYNVTFDDSKFNAAKAATLATALNAVSSKPTGVEGKVEQVQAATGNQEATYKAVFSNLEPGYYLITSSRGSNLILDTTTGTKEIAEKNDLPRLEKQVLEDSLASAADPTAGWRGDNDAAFGETVQFKIIVTVEAGAQNYVVTDTLPTGFELVEDTIAVKKNNETTSLTPKPASGSDNYQYEVSKDTDKNEFAITFTESFLNTLADANQLIITYDATVKETATVGGNGNENKAVLTFGTDTTNNKREATTKTYIWSFGITKKNNDSANLSNAKFTLYKNYDATTGTPSNEIKFEQVGTTTTYNQSTSGNAEIATGNTGAITFNGLDSGTYYLVETAAPAGYNKLTKPIKVTITGVADTAKGTVKYQDLANTSSTETTANNAQFDVVNNKGSLLPTTGGVGTTLFYIIGGILAVGAGVLLVTKKRMDRED